MFKIATITAAAATALALTGAAALADNHDEMPDFPWTEEQFMEAVPEATPETFTMIDLDGDGTISEEEYEQAIESGALLPPQR